MTFIYPNLLSTAFFLCIVISLTAALIYGVYLANLTNRSLKKNARREATFVAIAVLGWIGIFSVLVESHYAELHPIPGLPILFGLVIFSSTLFGLSPWGKRLAVGLPLPALVGFQAFRLPLELVLHEWVAQGSIPASMSWNGQNFDIITGLLALIVTPLVYRFKNAAWIVNGVGSLLLLNVMRVVVFSSPLPFAWSVNPPLQLIFYSPYFLIAPICVGGAIAGHVILTRALLKHHQHNAAS